MLAVGRLKIAAAAVGGSTLVAAIAQLTLAELVPARLVVAGLALGNTIGMTVVAIPFVIVTRRVLGSASILGLRRATVAGLTAAAAAGLVGAAVSVAIPVHHKLAEAGAGALAAVCVVIVFAAIAVRLDGGDLRAVLARRLHSAELRPPEQPDSRPRALTPPGDTP
jgi:hypothetical protein